MVEALTGPEVTGSIPALAQLRISVFADWPYLYDGDIAYEEQYLRDFAAAPDAVLVVARDSDTIVGASTASPMAAQAAEIRDPVVAYGFDPADVFYFGESVLMPEYRGLGIGHTFFDYREAHARRCGARYTMFAGVIRPRDHPLYPANYRPLDDFWRARGYEKVADLICHIKWADRGEQGESPKPLQFWMRKL